ncbi:MAG TPA: hypothetical protein VNA17_11320 [Pyrinomonadaceae bacterium]|nr:hypothetical protein [Pyrinomonadaceae bacterium]
MFYLGARANTYQIAKRYWTEILAMLHRRRYTRVLIEKEVAEKLAPHDILRLVSELAHSGYRDISFAIVDLGYDSQRAEFYELVAGNRGFMVKVTDNVIDAEGWLADRHIPVRRIAPTPGQAYSYLRTS